jgi:hypothetical protein
LGAFERKKWGGRGRDVTRTPKKSDDKATKGCGGEETHGYTAQQTFAITKDSI